MILSTNEKPLQHPIPNPPSPVRFPLTSPRGAKLATRVWRNQGIFDLISPKPKALLLIVHGSGWHSGYFEGLADHLGRAEIFCASYDQPGMGYSEAEQSSPRPDVIHISDFDWLVQDVFAAVDWMILEAGNPKDVPVFLLGESFGGIQVEYMEDPRAQSHQI